MKRQKIEIGSAGPNRALFAASYAENRPELTSMMELEFREETFFAQASIKAKPREDGVAYFEREARKTRKLTRFLVKRYGPGVVRVESFRQEAARRDVIRVFLTTQRLTKKTKDA